MERQQLAKTELDQSIQLQGDESSHNCGCHSSLSMDLDDDFIMVSLYHHYRVYIT